MCKNRFEVPGTMGPFLVPLMLLYRAVVDFLKKTLGDKVEKVSVSDR